MVLTAPRTIGRGQGTTETLEGGARKKPSQGGGVGHGGQSNREVKNEKKMGQSGNMERSLNIKPQEAEIKTEQVELVISASFVREKKGSVKMFSDRFAANLFLKVDWRLLFLVFYR